MNKNSSFLNDLLMLSMNQQHSWPASRSVLESGMLNSNEMSLYECRRTERAGGFMTKVLQVVEVGTENSIWPLAHDPTVRNKNLQICRSYAICT